MNRPGRLPRLTACQPLTSHRATRSSGAPSRAPPRAVAEDRLVIARELHDAVSGNLGAITVRCAVPQRLETTPDRLRSALSDVETASREATDALQRVLAVLRDERTPPTPGTVTAPALPARVGTGLVGSLAEAIDGARRAGLRAEPDAVRTLSTRASRCSAPRTRRRPRVGTIAAILVTVLAAGGDKVGLGGWLCE